MSFTRGDVPASGEHWLMEPVSTGEPEPYEWGRDLGVGGGLDESHVVAQVQLDGPPFELRLVDVVEKVHPEVRSPAERGLDGQEGALDLGQGEPACAEESHE